MRYPPNIEAPGSYCGDAMTPTGPPETCNEIEISAGDKGAKGEIPLAHDLYILVLDNPKKLPLDAFAKSILLKALILEPITAKKINNAESQTSLFQGALNDVYSNVQGGGFYEAKTRVVFIPLRNNKILRITYPVEFCFRYGKNGLFLEMSCFSDERNGLYEQIVNTLTLE